MKMANAAAQNNEQNSSKSATGAQNGGSLNDLPLQSASVDIWDKKYRLKTMEGEPVDASVQETFKRAARNLLDEPAAPIQKTSSKGEQ